MKLSVIVCLPFLACLTGYGQQSPSPSERVATPRAPPTLKETLTFISATANNPKVARLVLPETNDNYAELSETYDVASPSACTFEWKKLYFIRVAHTWRDSYAVNLADLDPNRIMVSTEFYRGTLIFSVLMWPKSDGQTFNVAHYELKGSAPGLIPPKRAPADWASTVEEAAISLSKTASCAPGDKNCSTSESKEPSASLFMPNEEVAHRLSRAIRHAALLCGAASTTPF
jgi:hypothetical protein